MKLKNLKKKIRRLEARLKEGPKKLAKLKQKLEAAMAASAEKAKRKLAARAREAQRVKPLASTPKKSPRAKAKPQMKPAGAKGPGAARKEKRKLNLSPERRAQLSAAMKARWAAKRTAPEENPPSSPTEGDFALGQTPYAS